MDQNNTDNVPKEALTDMAVGEDGSMQDVEQSKVVNVVQPPQSVMDVTPPPQDSVVSSEVPSLAEGPAELAEPVTQNDEKVVESPGSEQIVTPTGADTVTAAPEAVAHKTGKGLIVAISIVLAMILAAIAVLVVIKTKGTTKSASQSKTSQNSAGSGVSAAQPLTTTDVATASKDVDTSLSSLDDTKDFAPDSLTDAALGLQ